MPNPTNLPLNQATFLTSAARLDQCPADTGAEVAFCGRSNAGKSSAINYITNQRKLARVSKTPGRTQLINFFTVTDDFRLVDLPGYGYAKVPPAMKKSWQDNIDNYLRNRKSLKGLVLVMDIRHPLRPFDLMMIEWGAGAELPVHILLTKADKLKKGARKATELKVKRDTDNKVTVQTFSSLSGEGRDILTSQLERWASSGTDTGPVVEST